MTLERDFTNRNNRCKEEIHARRKLCSVLWQFLQCLQEAVRGLSLKGILMTQSRRMALAAALLLSSSLPLSGFSQTPGTPPQAMHPMMGGAQMEAHRDARHQKHLDELKVFLQLQASQEGAWQVFSDVMKTPMKRPGAHNPADMEKLSTPERIDKMMALKSERDAEISKRMNATKTFYASLTSTQQKVFDTHTHKFMRQGPMGHHGKMHP
jgi:Spy/CpxP family protein refolding chaperone